MIYVLKRAYLGWPLDIHGSKLYFIAYLFIAISQAKMSSV